MKRKWILGALVALPLLAAGAWLKFRTAPSADRHLTGPEYLKSLQDPARFHRSYYLPGSETQDISPGFPSTPVSLEGPDLPCPILVLNDLGGYLLRIGVHGDVDWAHRVERLGRGAAVFPGRLYYPKRKVVVVLDPATGRELDHLSFGGAKISFVNNSEGNLIVGLSESGPHTIQIYAVPQGTGPLKQIYSNPHPSSWARHAETLKGMLYVADTMAHRFYAVTMTTGELAWSREAYYPNDIKPMPGGRILVAEEHANRITEVDAFNQSYKVLFSCPDPLYRDSRSTLQDIQREEKSKTATTAAGKLMGLAAEENSGPATLYSPNGVTPVSEDSFFVADTDNHRVLLIRQGRIVSTLRGFNNPAKIYLLR